MSDRVYPLGDLNGDGYNDFAIASYYNWDDGLGRVYIFKGGETIADTPWCVLEGPKGITDFYYGYSVLGIGDFTNGGYNDFVVSTHSLGGADSSWVYLYSGGKDSLAGYPLKSHGPYGYIFDIKATFSLDGTQNINLF